MTQRNVAPPFPRIWLALGGLVVAGGLIWLVSALVFRDPAPRGTAARSSAGSPVSSPTARQEVAARPRAGVSGRVMDPEGKPVAAALVCAWASRASGLTSVQQSAPRCAATDTSGVYSLVDLFPATPLNLSAIADRFPPAGFHGPGEDGAIRLAEGEERTGIDFVLAAGGVQVKGRVSDATGGVVGGAVVVTDSLDLGGRAMATSNEKGEFTLWTAPGQIRLGATANGYAPGRAGGPAPGHFFEIFLLPGSVLVGHAVVAGTETPVVSAMIEAIQVEGGGARASTRTDGDGHFRIEGLTPGRFRVEATSEGREGYSRASVPLGMGETSPDVTVELDPAFIVRGVVVEKGSATPCTGGDVRITDSKQNEFSQAAIEPDGTVRMASVIPGKYKVEVSCNGHVPRDDYPIVIIEGRDAPPQTWEVDAGASVRVAVVDSAGKSVAAASVVASPSSNDGASGEGMSGGSADHAEADGSFLVAGLKPGGYHVSVRTPDGLQGGQDVTVDARREEKVKIELPVAGAIDGVVEDEDHHPMANIQVTAMGPKRATARSLDDGTFTLTGLPTGDYTVIASERGFRRGETDPNDPKAPAKVTVTAPSHARAKLVVDKRDGVIAGRVVDGSGQPVTDAFLDVSRAGGGFSRYSSSGRPPVVTDTEGRFSIEGLVDGDYNLRASRKGGGEATAERVKVGTRGLTMRLAEGASIAGVLAGPGGAGVDRFTFRARESKTSFDRSELFFHARGAFSLRDLPPGTYELSADCADGTATGEVTLAEGEQKTGITLTLALRGTVSGQLVAQENGAAIANARLMLAGDGRMQPMSGDGRSIVTGADGRFQMEGVLGGKWTLIVSSVDPSSAPFDGATTSIEVSNGGATNLGAVQVPRRVSAGRE